MRKLPNWKNSKYKGLSNKNIKKLWDDTVSKPSEKGTLLNYLVQCQKMGYFISVNYFV
jgi:hypothetical protein